MNTRAAASVLRLRFFAFFVCVIMNFSFTVFAADMISTDGDNFFMPAGQADEWQNPQEALADEEDPAPEPVVTVITDPETGRVTTITEYQVPDEQGIYKIEESELTTSEPVFAGDGSQQGDNINIYTSRTVYYADGTVRTTEYHDNQRKFSRVTITTVTTINESGEKNVQMERVSSGWGPGFRSKDTGNYEFSYDTQGTLRRYSESRVYTSTNAYLTHSKIEEYDEEGRLIVQGADTDQSCWGEQEHTQEQVVTKDNNDDGRIDVNDGDVVEVRTITGIVNDFYRKAESYYNVYDTSGVLIEEESSYRLKAYDNSRQWTHIDNEISIKNPYNPDENRIVHLIYGGTGEVIGEESRYSDRTVNACFDDSGRLKQTVIEWDNGDRAIIEYEASDAGIRIKKEEIFRDGVTDIYEYPVNRDEIESFFNEVLDSFSEFRYWLENYWKQELNGSLLRKNGVVIYQMTDSEFLSWEEFLKKKRQHQGLE